MEKKKKKSDFLRDRQWLVGREIDTIKETGVGIL